jgi:hypothetical protein
MSETKHTPEPWRIARFAYGEDSGAYVSAGPVLNIEKVIATLYPYAFYHMDAETANANAFRIVDCVNALAGIEDPEAFVKEAKAALQKDKFPFL